MPLLELISNPTMSRHEGSTFMCTRSSIRALSSGLAIQRHLGSQPDGLRSSPRSSLELTAPQVGVQAPTRGCGRTRGRKNQETLLAEPDEVSMSFFTWSGRLTAPEHTPISCFALTYINVEIRHTRSPWRCCSYERGPTMHGAGWTPCSTVGPNGHD